jgi:hypothetical protein
MAIAWPGPGAWDMSLPLMRLCGVRLLLMHAVRHAFRRGTVMVNRFYLLGMFLQVVDVVESELIVCGLKQEQIVMKGRRNDWTTDRNNETVY